MKEERRILVVDDAEIMRKLIVEKLSLQGYMVESASSGEEAIRKLEKSFYHLFIIDIKMPDISGLDILEKLDVKNNCCEAIIITGHGDLDSARAAMELGAFSYITKPFDNKDLMNQVKKALEMVALKKEKLDHMKELEEEVRSRTEESEREISEHKKAEKEKQKSEKHHKETIENIFKFVPEGLLVFTSELNLFRKNKTFQDIVKKYSAKLNYTEEELAKKIIEQIKKRIANGNNAEIKILGKK